MLIRSLIMGYLILLSAGPTFAQATPSLRIVVERTGKDGEDCGVTESSLRNTGGFIINSTGIRRAGDGERGIPVLHFSSNIVFFGGTNTCFGNIKVEVYGFTPADLRDEALGGFISESRNTVLCSHGGLVVQARGLFGSAFVEMAERAAKQCLGKLRY